MVGSPPAADTLISGPAVDGVKRITLSGLHAPPRPDTASHNVMTGPPAAATFFIFPFAKKPSERLSGDQNGKAAPSVPASMCDSVDAIGRSQSLKLSLIH